MGEFGPMAGLVDINRDIGSARVSHHDLKVLLYILTCKALYL